MKAPRLRPSFLFLLLVFLFWSLSAERLRAQWTPMNPVRDVHQETDGALFSMGVAR